VKCSIHWVNLRVEEKKKKRKKKKKKKEKKKKERKGNITSPPLTAGLISCFSP
jgi:hypothetical protein